MGFGVWGLGFGVWGLWVEVLGFKGFGVWGLGFGVWGLGYGSWLSDQCSEVLRSEFRGLGLRG